MRLNQLRVALLLTMGACSSMFWANNSKTLLTSLSFNGVQASYDNLYGTYMFPIPTSYRGKESYKAAIQFVSDDTTAQVYFDGQPVNTGDSVVFSSPIATSNHTIKVTANGNSISYQLKGNFLPIVVLNTSDGINGKTYTAGDIQVIDADDALKQQFFHAQLRYRGASAQNMTKKAFAVKLTNEAGESADGSFFGFRSDNNWILDAMAIDYARMRNRVSFDLWNDFSTKPYHQSSEKKAINGTRGRFVEVILNGNYQGLYCMTEKLDRKQLKLKKQVVSNTSEITQRGLLYKSEQWSYAVLMGHNPDSDIFPGTPPSMYNNMSDTWNSFEMGYPERADGEEITWKPLYDAISTVASNDTAHFAQVANDLFDLPVALDYYLMMDLLFTTDNHGKNMFYYVYDLTQSPKLGIAPWDLDGTWGRDYYSTSGKTSNAAQSYTDMLWQNEHGEHTLFKRLRETKSFDWENRLRTRYAALRGTYFTKESLTKRFSDYATLFEESGADVRERMRWNGVDNKRVDILRDVTYINNWISNRLDFLDRQYNYTTGLHTVLAPNTATFIAIGEQGGITFESKKAQSLPIYNLAGQFITTVHLSVGTTTVSLPQAGVYLVEGQKIIVR